MKGSFSLTCLARRTRVTAVALVAVLMPLSVPLAHAADDEALARYRQALAQVSQGGLTEARELADELEDFALYPYLRYALLRARLHEVEAGAVTDFLEAYPDLPIASRLRTALLRELAEREDWQALLSHYEGMRDVHVRCAVVRARHATGQAEAAVALAKRLWLVGYWQPEDCVPAFEVLEESGALTPGLIQERILLALEAENEALAQVLAKRLKGEAATHAERWLAVYREPAKTLKGEPARLGPAQHRRRVVAAALRHHAVRDPLAAHDLWPKARERFRVDSEVDGGIRRRIALHAAYNDHAQGAVWLRALPDRFADTVVHAWRVRSALRAGDWLAVIATVEGMPQSQRHKSVWRYWRARAQAEAGATEHAREGYKAVAGEFGYYGFLAADALGEDYHWGDSLPAADSERQDRVRGQVGARRALMLHRAEQFELAQLEWRAVVDGLDDRDRLAAGRIAERAGWPWAALHAAGRGGARAATPLRFPTAFDAPVRKASEDTGVAPAWLWALVHRESAFRRNGCSNAGACGLMQLMPDTARWILERDGHDAADAEAVRADPRRSVAAGASYLAYLRERFDGMVLAMAAYNAGPARVARWLDDNDAPEPASPRWIETLLVGETRDYLQAVLFNRVVYEQLLDGDAGRLSDLLACDSS